VYFFEFPRDNFSSHDKWHVLACILDLRKKIIFFSRRKKLSIYRVQPTELLRELLTDHFQRHHILSKQLKKKH
jgi:hypothetical protein